MTNYTESDGFIEPITDTLICNDCNATSSWNQAILFKLDYSSILTIGYYAVFLCVP